MCFGGKIEDPRDLALKSQVDQLSSITYPQAPDLMDASVIQAQLQKKRELASGTSGRTGTFLTGPSGLGGPSSSIAKDFILARLNNAPRPAPAPGSVEANVTSGTTSFVQNMFSLVDQVQTRILGKAK